MNENKNKKNKKRGAVDNLIFEREVLTLFWPPSMNHHDDKMYNTVVPPKMLLHKKNAKGFNVFLWISCMFNLISQQDKTHGTS